MRPIHDQAARALGRAIAQRGLGLVYGGAKVGLMGSIADMVIDGGGEVIGVIPRFLAQKEIAHDRIHKLLLVDSMHERKATMARFASAFIALPGGFGTLDELFEVLTWAQLGLHNSPVAVLDVDGYFGDVLAFADRAMVEGFVRPEHRGLLRVGTDPEALLDALMRDAPPETAINPRGPSGS